MKRVLAQWFGDSYHKVNQQQNSRFGMKKLPTQNEQGDWLPDVRCIHAHFHHGHGFGLPYFYPEIDQYISIMRDPFDLMVSMYFFIKGRSKQGQFWHQGRPVDITEKFPTIESYLKTYPYWIFSHLPQNLTLANYREKLAAQFVYIGIFEDLQTSVDRLAMKLGYPTMTLPVSNTSKYDETIPEEMRHQFYFDYPLLKKVYDFAAENYLYDLPTESVDGAVAQGKAAESVSADAVFKRGASDAIRKPNFVASFESKDLEIVCGDMLISEES